MKPMVRMMGAVALAALTACGPLNEGSAVQGAANLIKARITGAQATATPAAPALTRAQVDAQPGGFLILNAFGGGVTDALIVAGTNGNRVTWMGGRQISVTLEDGILVATRGLPRDLMAASVTGVRQALAQGGGNSSRVHETLSDEDQILRQVLQCSIAFKATESVVVLQNTRQARRFEEACRGERTVFTNTYWVDAAGEIIKSLQVVSADAGFVQLERP